MTSEAHRYAWRDAINAPIWWARSNGMSGSQRPLFLLFVLIVGFGTGIGSFFASGRAVDLLFAIACLLGVAGIDAWLMREMHRSN